MKDKVFFFVDGGYFYRGVKRLEVENVNLKNICEKIAGNREIVGICYYVGEIDIHMGKDKDSKIYFRELRIKQQKFLSKLKESGVDYKLGYFNKGGDTEKSVDMLLACDMIEKAIDNIFDVGIIITGDGDFQPAVKLIQDKLGKIILNGAFKGHFAKILMDTCTRFFFIDDKVKT
ncbi:NYN domain-containing protein [Candidatus Gracilibacteria bacterium]|nr:NYN domain-containing protein [Candidatus Gracilibacteria bacterium]